MGSFRTILFDLDGTLVDAFTTIHRSYVHTLPQFGLPAPDMASVRRAVGGGLYEAMAKFLPPEHIPAAMKVHSDHTRKILLEDVKAMPGALDLLRELHGRGLTLALYTNKNNESARRICMHLGFDPYLNGVFAANDTPWLKPQRELSEHVLKTLGAAPATTLLVGDSPFDVETAHNGGYLCWCVTTGTHNAEELHHAKADAVFTSLSEVGAKLK